MMAVLPNSEENLPMTELEKQTSENPEMAKAFRHAMDMSNLMIIAPQKGK